MNYGKSIRLFLVEGTADGRWMCELSNWTGKAYKIPRKYVKNSNDRPELTNTGIYFLFGKSDDKDKLFHLPVFLSLFAGMSLLLYCVLLYAIETLLKSFLLTLPGIIKYPLSSSSLFKSRTML